MKQASTSEKRRLTGIGLAPLFNIYLASTTSRKYCYANDLSLFHSSRDWKTLEGTLKWEMAKHNVSQDLEAKTQPRQDGDGGLSFTQSRGQKQA